MDVVEIITKVKSLSSWFCGYLFCFLGLVNMVLQKLVLIVENLSVWLFDNLVRVLELMNGVLLKFIMASLAILFERIDSLFYMLGLRCFQGSSSTRHFVYICVVAIYIYLLTTRGPSYFDDIVVSGCVFCYALNTLKFTANVFIVKMYTFCCIAYWKVKRFGKVRVIMFVLSIAAVAAVLTSLLVTGAGTALNIFSDNFMGRLDDNVIEIVEERNRFNEVIVHPVTKGERYPKFLWKMYRYPYEDVEMSCEFTKVWISGSRPTEYQVVWRKNGAPITLTDRHWHQLSFEEIKENDTSIKQLLDEHGFSQYKMTSTLTIHLLRESEFGAYTCHCAKHMNVSIEDWMAYNNLSKNKTHRSQDKEPKNQQMPKQAQCKQQNEIEEKRVFKDVFLHVGEIRLIKIRRRQEIIRAPVNSMLKFTTSYWHLAEEGDIEIDYSINRQSYYELCQDSYFKGCSKALLLYWLFGHGTGARFGIPPLHLFTIWGSPNYPAERYHLVHCLCENAYGYHTTKYVRKHYNRTMQQFQLIEILHPHVLVVVPREQNLLNLFVSRSQCAPVKEQPVCRKPPAVCKTPWDFQTIKEFAHSAITIFTFWETIILTVVSITLVYLIRKFNLFLDFLGRHINRLCLDGSMAYLATAQRNREIHGALPEHVPNEPEHFDVFLSFSESQTDTQRMQDSIVPLLETRDLAPNLPEVRTISDAIENSDKFLVFLTRAYFEDHFRKDIEAAIILESVSSRGNGMGSILLIKLDQCDIPAWLSHLSVHDWTSGNLSTRDHYRRLLKWLEPRERQRTFRSRLDMFVTTSTIFTVGVVSLICSLIVYLQSA